MTDPFHYSTTFKLDKAHLNECYSNTVIIKRPIVAYGKSIILLLVGIFMIKFTEVEAYLGYFLLGLGIVEALGCRFQQPWWVARQMFGRSGNSKVTLTIDEKGVLTHSAYVNSVILWQDISAVTPTKDGVLITHSQGRSYISDKCLSEPAKQFLMAEHN